MAWIAVRISLLIVRGSTFATLRVLVLGLVVKAPTIVRIAAFCTGSSSLRAEFDAELYMTAP